jgi:lactoylglutathione lyase
MNGPLFQKVDCVMFRVENLDEALAFYAAALGHQLVWRTSEAAGLSMPGTDAEIVLHTRQGPEVDMLVNCVEDSFERFVAAGGEPIAPPFDILIGRCAVVRDPFGNALVMLDQTKGAFATDADRRVVGVDKPEA